MTTAEKAEKVFQSGLAYRIWNDPVKFDQIWDIRLFWKETFFQIDEVANHKCPEDGFKDLDNCLDDILKHLEEHDKV